MELFLISRSASDPIFMVDILHIPCDNKHCLSWRFTPSVCDRLWLLRYLYVQYINYCDIC